MERNMGEPPLKHVGKTQLLGGQYVGEFSLGVETNVILSFWTSCIGVTKWLENSTRAMCGRVVVTCFKTCNQVFGSQESQRPSLAPC